MGKEVDMADAPPAETKQEAEEAAPGAPSVREQLRANAQLIAKAVALKETRTLFGRLLRQTAALRKQLNAAKVEGFVAEALPEGPAAAELGTYLAKVGSGSMEMDSAPAPSDGDAAAEPAARPTSALPEVEAYAYLLGIMLLVDRKQWAEAQALAAASVERLSAQNRRTLDVLAARTVFYLSWAAEKNGSLAEIRSQLLALHRTAVLRHDEIGQETLLNLLLRNYLHYSLYDQAEKLRAKAQRAEQPRSSQQHCRYQYYLGRIRATQLEYSEARDSLAQAARKAPSSAVGFRVEVAKWLALVRLLLGEVPERRELTVPELRPHLAAYYELAQAVRRGDLAAFSAVAANHAAAFRADRTQHLVTRLRHNVIRAGLRRVALSYSRIPLADVAAKLGLASVEDTRGIVAKAIRDGGIDATIDHEGGFLASARAADVYSSDEPQAAYHARVAFCMDIHNEAVRAMRFEGSEERRKYEDATRLRERQEQELQAALEEDEDF